MWMIRMDYLSQITYISFPNRFVIKSLSRRHDEFTKLISPERQIATPTGRWRSSDCQIFTGRGPKAKQKSSLNLIFLFFSFLPLYLCIRYHNCDLKKLKNNLIFFDGIDILNHQVSVESKKKWRILNKNLKFFHLKMTLEPIKCLYQSWKNQKIIS